MMMMVVRDAGEPGTAGIHHHADDVQVVTLAGEHDLGTVPEVRATFARATAPVVLVDLSTCTFLDSTVIAAIVHASALARSEQRRVELVVDPSARVVDRVVRLAGLDQALTLHTSLQDALEARPDGS